MKKQIISGNSLITNYFSVFGQKKSVAKSAKESLIKESAMEIESSIKPIPDTQIVEHIEAAIISEIGPEKREIKEEKPEKEGPENNNLPSLKVISNWETKYPTILIDKNLGTMYCMTCKDYREKTKLFIQNVNARAFLDGTSNFKTTNIETHLASKIHVDALKFFANKL